MIYVLRKIIIIGYQLSVLGVRCPVFAKHPEDFGQPWHTRGTCAYSVQSLYCW